MKNLVGGLLFVLSTVAGASTIIDLQPNPSYVPPPPTPQSWVHKKTFSFGFDSNGNVQGQSVFYWSTSCGKSCSTLHSYTENCSWDVAGNLLACDAPVAGLAKPLPQSANGELACSGTGVCVGYITVTNAYGQPEEGAAEFPPDGTVTVWSFTGWSQLFQANGIRADGIVCGEGINQNDRDFRGFVILP
jgi:hypothetical protein